MDSTDRIPDANTPVILQALYPNGGSPIYMSMTYKEAEKHAEFSAKAIATVMYRAFERLPHGGEHFITAWVIKNGKVKEHPEVTIPTEFF